jgi:hypothetical protein
VISADNIDAALDADRELLERSRAMMGETLYALDRRGDVERERLVKLAGFAEGLVRVGADDRESGALLVAVGAVVRAVALGDGDRERIAGAELRELLGSRDAAA